MRKFKINFFGKTFGLVFSMMLSVTIVAFVLIYLLLPRFYLGRLERDIRFGFSEQVYFLETADTLTEELFFLNLLFSQPSYPFTLLDEEGNVIGSMAHYGGVSLQEDGVTISENEEDDLPINVLPDDEISVNTDEFIFPDGSYEAVVTEVNLREYLEVELSYYTASDGLRTVLVSIPIQPLEDALMVMTDIYPIVLILSLLFTLVVTFIFSKWVVSPMKKIRLATSRMIKLEPDVNIEVYKTDEIGCVVSDINQLYRQLRATITSLETEITKYSDAENQKIEFLQTVSHEMKAPLVTASALADGMIHNIPPYHENKEEHLKELKFFLEKTVTLTKESLDLSEKYKEDESNYGLLDLIREVSRVYGIIFASRQLAYQIDVSEDIQIMTKANIFGKILSNLFSNVANHTDVSGKVHVSYSDNTLSIFNTCTPLTVEVIEEIFKPLTTQSANEHSTGLGLFIVQQLLLQLGILHSFEPDDKHEGMVFKLHFPSEMIKEK